MNATEAATLFGVLGYLLGVLTCVGISWYIHTYDS